MEWTSNGPKSNLESGLVPGGRSILGIAAASADHTGKRYRTITLPMFAAMKPAPKVRLVEFQAGIHAYSTPEPGLPRGVAPAVVQLWHQAIMNGYYTDYARVWAEK